MDVVMFESSERERGRNRRVVDNVSHRFGQVNAFLRLLDRAASADRAVNKYQEFVFVQYFGFVGSSNVSNDAVEMALGCNKLCWASGDLFGDLTPGKYVGLCPLGSLRGTAHVFEVSKEVNKINEKLERTSWNQCTAKKDWMHENGIQKFSM